MNARFVAALTGAVIVAALSYRVLVSVPALRADSLRAADAGIERIVAEFKGDPALLYDRSAREMRRFTTRADFLMSFGGPVLGSIERVTWERREVKEASAPLGGPSFPWRGYFEGTAITKDGRGLELGVVIIREGDGQQPVLRMLYVRDPASAGPPACAGGLSSLKLMERVPCPKPNGR